MATRLNSENLQTLFTFPFKDEKWKTKLGIAVAIACASILIIPGFFIGGYLYEIMRRIIVDDELSLPEWDDTGQYFINGLKMAGVGLVASLPMLLFSLPYFLTFLPLVIMGDMPKEYEGIFMIAMFATMGLMMLGSVLSMVTSILILPALGHMIVKDEFAAAFRIREWWPIFRKNIGGYLLSFVIILGVSWLFSFAMQFLMLTIILCFVAPLLWAAFYVYMGIISSAMYAQAYQDGAEKVK